jgi:hypothetical protein
MLTKEAMKLGIQKGGHAYHIRQIRGPALARGEHLHVRCEQAAGGVEEHCDEAQTGTCASAPRDLNLRHLHDYVNQGRDHSLSCAIAGGGEAARLKEGEREGDGEAGDYEPSARDGEAPL